MAHLAEPAAGGNHSMYFCVCNLVLSTLTKNHTCRTIFFSKCCHDFTHRCYNGCDERTLSWRNKCSHHMFNKPPRTLIIVVTAVLFSVRSLLIVGVFHTMHITALLFPYELQAIVQTPSIPVSNHHNTSLYNPLYPSFRILEQSANALSSRQVPGP